MENAEVHVERGTEQLQRAAYYQVSLEHSTYFMPVFQRGPYSRMNLSFVFFLQQKSRKKMCILLLVCSIALIILGIIIWQVSQ